jgi:DNA-directed RNA polymerase subunit K/omega
MDRFDFSEIHTIMEELRDASKVVHSEVVPVTRSEIKESLSSDRLTLPYFSKYEYTVLLGIRSQQLSEGAKPLCDLKGLVQSRPDFVWELAKKEISEKKLPYIIHRRLPNGVSEYWNASELAIVW